MFTVGHCLYGCLSCNHKNSNIPVYFTRYYRNELAYTAKDVIRKYQDKTKRNVLVSPSTAQWSSLARPDIARAIVSLQRTGEFHFVVKFHAAVFRYNMFHRFVGGKVGDSLSRLSPQEQEYADLLMQNCTVVAEDEFNVLPFLEAFDTVNLVGFLTLKILCDLESSVAFETLYFSNKVVLAFDNKERPYEQEYKDQFHVYHTPEELKKLLTSPLSPKVGGDSFFQSKYLKVDGTEVEKTFELRKWHEGNWM